MILRKDTEAKRGRKRKMNHIYIAKLLGKKDKKALKIISHSPLILLLLTDAYLRGRARKGMLMKRASMPTRYCGRYCSAVTAHSMTRPTFSGCFVVLCKCGWEKRKK
jgi:hypothetical protein